MPTRILSALRPGSFIVRAVIVASTAITSSAFADVTVTQPWVRGTVPPQRTTGAFMTLQSSSDAKLVAVSSPAAKQVEIHEMAMVDNVMRMRPVAEIALPAGKAVELRPGGYHIMLMGIAHQLKEGELIPLTLTVRDRDGKTRTVAVQAPVRALTSPAPRQSAPPNRK